ncbi:protein gamma response 1-like [Coffea eugenioides]|uniref:protein gamma response 1-like n=1 Tax=Coffea eugenioides TaxID=49369 RepID=UPI000F61386F|nr:protein gamma response 1-like [Coffea eugenioides]XP_027163048.1 protein gamma response 1-like [Coffea eugenioides]
MDGNLQKSPQLGSTDDSMEFKYISGLSTILVATIQEAKDRISQIEYVFCSQIYPHFQAKSKTLQRLYSEARESAENACKEREKDLLLQIGKLQLEKQQFCAEISSLKLEREEFASIGLSPDSIRSLQEDLQQKTKDVGALQVEVKQWHDLYNVAEKLVEDRDKELKELDDKRWKLFTEHTYLEREVKGLKSELANKTREFDAAMGLQLTLLQMVRSNTSLMMDKEEEQLTDHQGDADLIIRRFGIMNGKIDELQEELRKKNEEIEKGRKVRENLLKKVESQASEIMEHEQQLNEYEKEKRLLATRLVNLQNDINFLEKEIGKKNDEVEEGRILQEQLMQQIDSYNFEKLKIQKDFEELVKEKRQLLEKLGRGPEEKVDMHQPNLQEGSQGSSEEMELHGKLLQQIEAKDSQLMSEKQKRKEVIVAYKNLKSQYNFLCSKYGLTTENALPQNRMEDQSDTLGLNHSPLTSVDVNKGPNASGVSGEAERRKGEGEELKNDKEVQLNQRSNSVSPSRSRTSIQPKTFASVKSCPPAGTKRPVSYWRNTRSNQSKLGPDLHDDFLDTPLEKIRGDLGNAIKDQICNPPEPAQKDIEFNSSDDETEDMNVDREKCQIPPQRPGTSNFKFVEPVRKKTVRENLKGIECKQCKKFYDAVLPNECKEGNGNGQNMRCEHHDGVSRHRYRYAPPLTPEGFWNIGFESEM